MTDTPEDKAKRLAGMRRNTKRFKNTMPYLATKAMKVMDDIRELVDASDLGPEDRNATVNLAEDERLICRATGAYFAEMANDAEHLTKLAYSQINGKILGVGHDIFGPEVASVDRKGKMPVVTLSRGSCERLKRDVVAKYRYNPKSDKLQRIG